MYADLNINDTMWCVVRGCVRALKPLRWSASEGSLSAQECTDELIQQWDAFVCSSVTQKWTSLSSANVYTRLWRWTESSTFSEETEQTLLELTGLQKRIIRVIWMSQGKPPSILRCRFNLRRLVHRYWQILFPCPLATQRFAVSSFCYTKENRNRGRQKNT